jgi:DNA polymerase III alpha subunit
MLTFGRLAGRSILKEVLRVNEACSFDEMNEITSRIPNEASISDLLENMENPSVIRWALEYDRDSLADYCYLDDDDNLVGEYSKIFEQAMRMEGKHLEVKKRLLVWRWVILKLLVVLNLIF